MAEILELKGEMMKRMGSAIVLFAIMAMPAEAQRQGRLRGPAGPDQSATRERARDLSADAIIRLQERLSLTEEQVENLKEAQRSDREVRDALGLETRAMRDRLRDGEITREGFREELEGLRSTARDGRTAYRQTLESVLTEEQRSQMRDIRSQANRGQRARGDRARPARSRGRGPASRGPQGR